MREKIRTIKIDEKEYELWLSDEPAFIKECVDKGIAVIEYIRDTEAVSSEGSDTDTGPNEQPGSFLTPWAADDISVVRSDKAYMEKVIRRTNGLPVPVAETERLVIRELCGSDVADIDAFFSAGAEDFIDNWSGSREEKIRELTSYCRVFYDLYGYGYYGIAIKSDPEVLIGIAGFREYSGNHDLNKYKKFKVRQSYSRDIPEYELELGYIIKKEFRQQGYCTEACLKLAEITEANICIIADRANTAGIKTAEKIQTNGAVAMEFAQHTDETEIFNLYKAVIEKVNTTSVRLGWNTNIYPGVDFIRKAIADKEMCIIREDGHITAAAVVNHNVNPEYDDIKWEISGPKEKISTIHALAVLPDRQGKKVSYRMLSDIEEYCRENGDLAVHLDVIDTNTPAYKLYSRNGYREVECIKMYYEVVGTREFHMMEHVL